MSIEKVVESKPLRAAILTIGVVAAYYTGEFLSLSPREKFMFYMNNTRIISGVAATIVACGVIPATMSYIMSHINDSARAQYAERNKDKTIF